LIGLDHSQMLEYFGDRPSLGCGAATKPVAGHTVEALKKFFAFFFDVVHRFRESRVHQTSVIRNLRTVPAFG
jgi:hypothetical protein